MQKYPLYQLTHSLYVDITNKVGKLTYLDKQVFQCQTREEENKPISTFMSKGYKDVVYNATLLLDAISKNLKIRNA